MTEFLPNSNEEAAYKCGLNGEIPMPKIIRDQAMMDAWLKGMDDRKKVTITEIAKKDLFSTYWIALAIICIVATISSCITYFVLHSFQ